MGLRALQSVTEWITRARKRDLREYCSLGAGFFEMRRGEGICLHASGDRVPTQLDLIEEKKKDVVTGMNSRQRPIKHQRWTSLVHEITEVEGLEASQLCAVDVLWRQMAPSSLSLFA